MTSYKKGRKWRQAGGTRSSQQGQGSGVGVRGCSTKQVIRVGGQQYGGRASSTMKKGGQDRGPGHAVLGSLGRRLQYDQRQQDRHHRHMTWAGAPGLVLRRACT